MTEPLPFEAFLDRFIALYMQGAFEDALALLDEHAPRLTEAASQILAWRCALLARLGRADEAVQCLREADTRGFWYQAEALREDPDFATLQDLPEFAGLVERFAARRAEAVGQIRPERKLISPAGEAPRSLCLVLHGNSSNIAETAPRWLPVTRLGWALACLQSSQPGWTEGLYVWDDVPRALDEVHRHLAELRVEYLRDSAPGGLDVIAGGFSMGAHAAVYMALDPRFALRGVIAHEA